MPPLTHYAVLTSALLALVACSDAGASGRAPVGGGPATVPAAVEAVPIERGTITLRRVFNGTLEASARVQIAPRIAGHLERLTVDIGDPIGHGEVIAWIDDDELVQAVAQAEADLAVASAGRDEAEASSQLAERSLERVTQLRTEGVTSESQFDSARASSVAARAAVQVAEARVLRAEAALESARVRLQRTRIFAEWDEPERLRADAPAEPVPTRVVAERFVDEGTIVNAQTPIVSIVSLQPIVAVVFIPERDYARLAIGQDADLTTDAYPGETFSGRVARIAPVFRSTTRQVRIELEIANDDLRLKPGMFVRSTLELARDEEATIVPYAALTTRRDERGVFVLPPGESNVRWVPVEMGLREDDRIQVRGSGLVGRVVTLGQELCDDGSRVTTPDAGDLR
ncbi:MAG: efflux RND transporter periplasmic adaptor subunit [Planctomycetota bacterium]